jgi:hypothetical protein
MIEMMQGHAGVLLPGDLRWMLTDRGRRARGAGYVLGQQNWPPPKTSCEEMQHQLCNDLCNRTT